MTHSYTSPQKKKRGGGKGGGEGKKITYNLDYTYTDQRNTAHTYYH